MPILTTCNHCSKVFSKAPSYHREAARRGTEVKFCSRACTDAARSAGTIGTKKRRGENLKCEVCGGDFYRPPSMVAAGKARFCSEACRLEAHRRKLVDRTGPRPGRKNGEEIACTVCGETRYRKKSLLERGIDKTCGKQACISTFSRGLWGLGPQDPVLLERPIHQRKMLRPTNFTQAQRREWIGTHCVWCGATENLVLDHVIPVCAGGQSVKENAQTLCGPCNNWKAMTMDRPMARRQIRSGG